MNKNIRVSVIGLGKLGSPLLAVLAKAGFESVGVDLNPFFVQQINAGIAPVIEPQLQHYISDAKEKIRATDSYEDAVLNSDLTFIIVPTPSQPNGTFSNDYVLKAVIGIAKALKKKDSYHVINITSTVMPGSCEGEILEAIEHYSGKSVGKDIGLCYNPEFIALGSVIKNMEYPDMCLIGQYDQKSGDILAEVYTRVCKNNPKFMRMNLVNAELTKIAVNTFVTTKISYANMLADVCEKIPGANASVVCEAIGMDSRIGHKYISPGAAFGGPCFPRDNQAYISLASSLKANSALASATKEINDYQIKKLINMIDSISDKERIGFIGASYKIGTPIIEESAAIKVIDALLCHSRSVYVYDELAAENLTNKYGSKIVQVKNIGELFELANIVVSTLENGAALILQNQQYLPKLEGKKYIECWGGDSRKIINDLGGKYYSFGSMN
jgi:UDPglucose 6-dehydrogenase